MKKMLFTMLILSTSLMLAAPQDAIKQEGFTPKHSFRDAIQDERTEFLVENLQWRVKAVLDSNGRVKPDSVDTAQELLRETCCNDAFTGSLETLLKAGVNPHTVVEGRLSPKEVAARYSTFALWILEEHETKGTFKQDASK